MIIFCKCLASFTRTAFVGQLIMLGCCLTSRAGQSASLAWSPSTDPAVIGYNVYYGGDSGIYTNIVSVGVVSGVVIAGLVEGATYYFAVTAFDAFGQESFFSNEATYLVPSATQAQLSVGNSSPGTFSFTATGQAGHIYEIQATTDFSAWTVLGTQPAAADGSLAFTDYDAANYPERFYRTRDTQP